MAKYKNQQSDDSNVKRTDPADLRRSLSALNKSQLVDLLMNLAEDDDRIRWALVVDSQKDVTPEQLVDATRHAIALATAFDKKHINHNFRYDSKAYDEIKLYFSRLIESGHLSSAMELSLDLMSLGSYQVECSDEGLMTTEVEDCLDIVIKAVAKSDLTANVAMNWHATMIKQDRVGFIAETQLESLRNYFSRSTTR